MIIEKSKEIAETIKACSDKLSTIMGFHVVVNVTIPEVSDTDLVSDKTQQSEDINERNCFPDKVLKAIETVLMVDREMLQSSSRKAQLVLGRHLFMKIMNDSKYQFDSTSICGFVSRNRTTIYKSLKTIEFELNAYPEKRTIYEAVIAELNKIK